MATASAASARTVIEVPHSQPMVALLGPSDQFLRLIEAAFPNADILVRGNQIAVSGDSDVVGAIDTLVSEMLAMLRTGQGLSPESVERSIGLLKSGNRPSEVLTANILSNRGKTIRPKTLNQKRYVDAIDAHTTVSSQHSSPVRRSIRNTSGQVATDGSSRRHVGP